MKGKIFIIDDDKELTDLIELILLKEDYEVRKFYSGKGVLEAISRQKPDLILLDIMLPDQNGLQLCEKIKSNKETATIPIIVISVRKDEYDILNAFSFGCADYITKPFNEKILLARIKACLVYKTPVSYASTYYHPVWDCETNELLINNTITFDSLEIFPDKYSASINKNDINLTPLEFKLLFLLVKNHGKVFRRSQIFDQIYENDYSRGDRSIDILINRLRKKLGSYGNWLETVYGIGYCFRRKN